MQLEGYLQLDRQKNLTLNGKSLKVEVLGGTREYEMLRYRILMYHNSKKMELKSMQALFMLENGLPPMGFSNVRVSDLDQILDIFKAHVGNYIHLFVEIE